VGFCLARLQSPASNSTTSAQPDTSFGGGSSGIAVLDVNTETGKVTRVRIERSSGSRRYDVAVMDALRHQHFAPHGEKEVGVPFSINQAGSFTQKDVEQYLSRHGVNANAVSRRLRLVTRFAAIQAMATRYDRYELTVAPTGQVTSVKIIQSTGSGRLDQAATNALHNWRFRPGAVTTVLIAMHFDLRSGFFRILLE
jgi:TonB family protein